MGPDPMDHTEYDSDPQAATQSERLRVARIGKPHGIRGEVTAQLFTDDPAERLAAGASVLREAGEQSGNALSSSGFLTVASQRWNKKICLLRFEEVNDRSAAEALRGSVLFVDVGEKDDDAGEGWYSHELEDLMCVDAEGNPLGSVQALLTGPAQDLLVVTSPNGDEVMVPFVDEIVPDIDLQRRRITLTPPEGLFP